MRRGACASLAPGRRSPGCWLGQGGARAPTVCDEAWRRGNEAYLHGDYAAAVAAYEEVDRQGVAVGRPRASTWATPISARARSAPRSGRSSGRWRSIPATRTRATTSTRRASWRRAAPTIASRARTRIRPGSAARRRGRRRRRRRGRSSRSTSAFFAVLIARRRARSETASGAGARSPRCWPRARCWRARCWSGACASTASRSASCCPTRSRSRKAPTSTTAPASTAHAGLRVRVVDRDQDWLRVRLANGLEGWVRAQEIGRI